MFLHFDEFSRKKLPKVLRFVKKHEKSSIWPNLCIFSSKLPWFGISMKFSAKSYKKCLISWKSTKNRRFLRELATFPTNYHVLTLWWTFQRKVAESASFPEKTLKIIDLAKTFNFSNKLPYFGISMIIAGKSCKKVEKVAHFVKNDKKSSIWPKLATFSGNYHVSAFLSTFSKKWVISWKSTKNRRFGKNYATFSNKLPCLCVSMIIAGKSCKKVEKVAHFVKNDEKSSIWPKLATFRANYHVSAFLSTFQQKVSHFVKKHEKSSFGSCLAHS